MKLEFVIPTSAQEIPLMNYQSFMKMADNSNDEEFIAQKMIEIFCGIELKSVVNIRMSDVNRLVEHFTKLFEKKPEFQIRFKIDTVEFGFIPDLENITFGEYIDLDNNLGDIQNLHKAMAVMYRPIKKEVKGKYEIEDYNGTANYSEVMKYAPLSVALGAMVFFYTLRDVLLKATLSYLSKEMKEMTATTTQKKRSSQSNGDGINQSMLSVKETLESLKALPEWDYSNVSPISVLKSKRMILKQEELND